MLLVSLQYGDTALHTAARYGHAGVTRILIGAHCSVNESNKVTILSITVSVFLWLSRVTGTADFTGLPKAMHHLPLCFNPMYTRNRNTGTAFFVIIPRNLYTGFTALDFFPRDRDTGLFISYRT